MADAPPSTRLRAPDTASRCRAESMTATHDLEVCNFSLVNDNLGAGRSINSAPFNVGGYNWQIDFYPDGSRDRGWYGLAASAFVSICDGAVGARARFTLSLVGRDGKASRHWRRRATTGHAFGWPNPASWGFRRFYLKPFLPLSRCLVDDRLTIRCELTVLAPLNAEEATPVPPPPPELPHHLRSALRDGRGADVTFDVAGRAFRAHRVLLAARSPVFCAELYGAMAERDPNRVIEIVDMEPAVFEMLLDFIYTDSLLPGSFEEEGCSNGNADAAAMTQHLLVAADRYGMERLKFMCAEKLRRGIDVSTVTATLALADQHHCQLLKEACIAFLSSPETLRLVLATDVFKQLMATCPLLLNGNTDNVSTEKK